MKPPRLLFRIVSRPVARNRLQNSLNKFAFRGSQMISVIVSPKVVEENEDESEGSSDASSVGFSECSGVGCSDGSRLGY